MEKYDKIIFIHKPIIRFQDLKFLLIFIVFQLHLFFRDSYKKVEGVILRATFKQYRTCLFNAIYTGPQATRRSSR